MPVLLSNRWRLWHNRSSPTLNPRHITPAWSHNLISQDGEGEAPGHFISKNIRWLELFPLKVEWLRRGDQGYWEGRGPTAARMLRGGTPQGRQRMAGGSLTNKTAEEALVAIRTLAVNEESPMVSRAALYAMHQDGDEPVRTFAARGRGQARTCKFIQDCPQCSTAVDFTDTLIRDVVTRGLDDQEIQQDLLCDRNQKPCLDEVIQFVESKESGKRSAIRLLDSHAVGAISRYHMSKKDEIKASNSKQLARRAAAINRPNSDPHEPCHCCVKRGNGKRRCHRSEQLNVQHTDMSANTATNDTASSPYVVASQLGERTVKTTQRLYSSPSVHWQNTSALYTLSPSSNRIVDAEQ